MTFFARLFGKQDQPTHPITKSGEWAPTHRHRKGGGYRLLCIGVNEADRQPVAIYDDAQGTIWVRDQKEFEDGRFTPI